MTSWYLSNPALLEEVQELVAAELPAFHVDVENGVVFVRGSLLLKNSETGIEIDRYDIEVQLPDDYPKSVPFVRETGGRLPRIADRHFNPSDGTACLFLPEERLKYYPKSATIVDFIRGPVYQFFLGQTFRTLEGNPLFGEWDHGEKGRLQYYEELLGTSNSRVILKFLRYLSAKRLKAHWPCYCGSGKKLRECHANKVLELQEKITRRQARESEAKLRKHLQSQTMVRADQSDKLPRL